MLLLARDSLRAERYAVPSHSRSDLGGSGSISRTISEEAPTREEVRSQLFESTPRKQTAAGHLVGKNENLTHTHTAMVS